MTKIRILIKIENLKNSKTTSFKTIKINNSNLIKLINLNKNRSRERLLNVFENLTTTKLFCSKLNVIIVTKKHYNINCFEKQIVNAIINEVFDSKKSFANVSQCKNVTSSHR